ncbi:AMP-binding protein [Saccharothrix syringae]|uniref:Peptide synthetase n=1 Tax=Saccharothrix syringae TaxID=103733 RepID=A0A5Q0H2B0_SACSY|nr:non-ribosomal peptide synthetase [Saccharothrix syringae]QFZ20321.1 peptide synthetase [Saccharothrix syringae]
MRHTAPTKVPHATLLSHLLTRAAAGDPARGVRFCLGDDVPAGAFHSYAALHDQASHLLAALRARGCAPGAPVALLLEGPDDFVPAFWACVLGGMPVCPLPPPRADPRHRAGPGPVAALLEHPVVVTTRALRERLPTPPGARVVDLGELRAHPRGDAPTGLADRPVRPDDTAVLMPTSGSTGGPKAVRLTHANLLAATRARVHALGLHGGDVALNWVTHDHVVALEIHLLALALGVSQVLTDPRTVLPDPARLLRLVDAHRVSLTSIPNSLLGALNRTPPHRRLDLSCLRRVLSGGEANAVGTGTAFLDRLAPHGLDPGALWPAYGMTETCAGVLFNGRFPGGDLGRDFAAVGHPVPGVSVRVTDDAGAVLPAGGTGELQLRGPVISPGYLGDPAATSAAFTADGWLRTGDVARVDDGRVLLVGRRKDTVIVNGVNHHSQEIEAVLAELVPGEVAAFPTRERGGDTERLVIAVATATRDDALLTAVRDAVTAHWGFAPALVLPLPADAFPRTGSGKLQRSLMRERLEAGAYDEHRAAVEVPPRRGGSRGPREAALVGIVADLLARDPATVDAGDNFFDLGGTSLQVLRLKHLIGRATGAQVPASAIFAAPTLRDLAGRLADSTATAPRYDPVVTLQPTGDGPPLFAVHPAGGDVLSFAGLAQHFAGDRPFCALQARGLEAGEEPFRSLAEMVDTYVGAIRRRQPRGPYVILGYSFGALVAFEIAKALEDVAFLGVIDQPPALPPPLVDAEHDRGLCALFLTWGLDLVTDEEADELLEELVELPPEKQLAHVMRIAPAHRLAELDLTPGQFIAWTEVMHVANTFLRDYRPTGRVRSMTVFHVEPPSGAAQWLRHLRRWDAHGADRYVKVPGNHFQVLAPAHSRTFHRLLRAELVRAAAG